MSLAATATMVLMLLLLAGFWIIQTGLLAGLEFTEQKVEVVAYLAAQRDRGPGRRRSPSEIVALDPTSRRSTIVTRDEALERFRESDGGAGPRGPDPVPRHATRCTPASRSS